MKKGDTARAGGPETGKACARCGRRFQPTPTRRITCTACYGSNSRLDPVVWRAGLTSGWRRLERQSAWGSVT